jgi:hypothetical protein
MAKEEREERSGASVPTTMEPASTMTPVEPSAAVSPSTPAAANTSEPVESDGEVVALEEEAILAGEGGAPPAGGDLHGRGFTSSVEYRDRPADCVVIACSDQRFRLQTLELVRHLGFSNPQLIQIPGGLVVSLPLLAASGFLSKAVDRIVEKALEVSGVETVICVAHEDCGGYRAENVRFLDTAVRRLTGGSIRETQITHLRKAARRLQLGLRQTTVRAFFADVAEPRVTFREIDITRR